MRCEGQRCSNKKRDLGPVVWLVDKKRMCATCFEQWIEKSDTVFDEHEIVRFDAAPDKSFELHKGKDLSSRKRAVALPA